VAELQAAKDKAEQEDAQAKAQGLPHAILGRSVSGRALGKVQVLEARMAKQKTEALAEATSKATEEQTRREKQVARRLRRKAEEEEEAKQELEEQRAQEQAAVTAEAPRVRKTLRMMAGQVVWTNSVASKQRDAEAKKKAAHEEELRRIRLHVGGSTRVLFGLKKLHAEVGAEAKKKAEKVKEAKLRMRKAKLKQIEKSGGDVQAFIEENAEYDLEPKGKMSKKAKLLAKKKAKKAKADAEIEQQKAMRVAEEAATADLLRMLQKEDEDRALMAIKLELEHEHATELRLEEEKRRKEDEDYFAAQKEDEEREEREEREEAEKEEQEEAQQVAARHHEEEAHASKMRHAMQVPCPVKRCGKLMLVDKSAAGITCATCYHYAAFKTARRPMGKRVARTDKEMEGCDIGCHWRFEWTG
jgi:hypothetical protein